MGSIAENLERVLEKIKIAAGDRKDIKLIAVSKTKPLDAILEAFHAGQLLFGENKVQEARNKKAELPPEADLHLIGPLQKNKAKYCPAIFSTIHTLHRADIASALNKKCLATDTKLDVLLQMNLTGETTKSGLTNVDDLKRLSDFILECSALKLKGLMTIGNPVASERDNQALFARLRELNQKEALRLDLQKQMVELSTGMSSDYELAIKEGATYVRVGTAIFGQRDYSSKL